MARTARTVHDIATQVSYERLLVMSTQSRASRLWTTYRSNLDELNVCLRHIYLSCLQCSVCVVSRKPLLPYRNKEEL